MPVQEPVSTASYEIMLVELNLASVTQSSQLFNAGNALQFRQCQGKFRKAITG